MVVGCLEMVLRLPPRIQEGKERLPIINHHCSSKEVKKGNNSHGIALSPFETQIKQQLNTHFI